MGLFDDIVNGLNAWANLKKADAEQIKAKTQQKKVRKLRNENRILKKNLTKNNKIGIIGIGLSVLGVVVAIILAYFPVQNFP